MRDLEAWKRALLTLPGDRFLVLVRNYIGEIRTPYNKQDLIRQLASFLADPAIQEKMVALIDQDEARVLTALMILGPVSLESLSLVFEGRIGLLALGEMLSSLEERLLIYRERVEVPLAAVTPILEPALRSAVFDSGALLPWRPSPPPNGSPPLWVSDAALLAIASLLCAGGIPQKKGGGLRKRELSALAAIFPRVGPESDEQSRRIERALSALLPLLEAQGLVADDGRPRAAAWRALASRDALGRTAALLAPLLGPEVRGDAAAHVVAACLKALAPPGAGDCRAFEPAAVASLCALLALRGAPAAARSAASLVAGLRALNVLVDAGAGLALHPDLVRPVEESAAVVQPNFEVAFPGGAALGDALDVALAAEARRVDAVVVFEITRGSFQRYLDLGGGAERLLEVLEGLAGRGARGRPAGAGALPQNVLFSLRTWEREYRRLALYEGVVLIADEEHQYLLDNSPLLRRYVRKKVAPGVYLLAADERDAWMAALRRSGVEHVPEIVTVRPEALQEEPGAELPFEAPLLGPDLALEVAAPRTPDRAPDAGARAALLQELERLGLSDEDAAEVRVRIDRRLILLPSQLRPLATEKGEARGLDYLGKVRLIERAMEKGALVELLARDPSGAPRRILARPQRLDKSASGLVLLAEALPEREPVAVSVSRLSRVRLVMRSLLE